MQPKTGQVFSLKDVPWNPCISLVNPLYIPCISLVYPLYIPCISLVYLLYADNWNYNNYSKGIIISIYELVKYFKKWLAIKVCVV